MASYRAPPTPADRAKAIAAVAAVHLGLAAAVVLGGREARQQAEATPPTQLIDVALPPPPPPPPPPEPAASPEREAGAAGRKAEPSPIVLPPPKIAVPTPNPLPVAPVAGTGSATSAGAASAGTGPGAGGSGSGRGGGGSGGIGTDVRLLGGNRAKLPASLLRQFAADRGTAQLLLTIAATGRVSECSVLAGTGSPEVDQALCNVMTGRSRWQPARDLQGRPVSVRIRYTAIWSKD
jgi:periplasmic protein TonB